MDKTLKFSTKEMLREAWKTTGEPAYMKVGFVPMDSVTGKQIQVERWRDLIDWLDTADGRKFMSSAYPEIAGYLYPEPAAQNDKKYSTHLLKCRSIIGNMSGIDGKWELVEPDEIVAPRRSPIIFSLTGLIVGSALTAIAFLI